MTFAHIENILGSNTHGMLPKALYSGDNGIKYMVKGARYNNNQPYAEVLASMLAKELSWFSSIQYWLLPSIWFPNQEWNHTKVSICRMYEQPNTSWMSVQSFMKANDITDPDVVFDKYFTKEFLGALAAFDFLIGNTDRHLGNIALMVGTQTTTCPAPVFDFGESFFLPFNNYTQINKYRDYLPKIKTPRGFEELRHIAPAQIVEPALEALYSRLEVLSCY